MQTVEISLEMIDRARNKAEEMGKLNNSILKGRGNVVGFIGEQIAIECMDGTWDNNYSHDILLSDGTKVDVKTKQTSVTPLPTYDCSVANFNTRQECDMYAFVRVKNDFTVGWYLGSIGKKEYFEKAVFMKKGDIDPSNNYTVRADCYNLKINQLHA
mgnify:CR=1 FL=1